MCHHPLLLAYYVQHQEACTVSSEDELRDLGERNTFSDEWEVLKAQYDNETHPYAALFAYVEKNVLTDKESFCKAWLDRVPHRNIVSSQIVEISHSRLKRGAGLLRNCNIPTAVLHCLASLDQEEVRYMQTHADILKLIPDRFNIPLYSHALHRVSFCALDIFLNRWKVQTSGLY